MADRAANSSTAPRRPRRRLSLGKRVIFAALATLGFFLGIEMVVRSFGLAPATAAGDPYVDFAEARPLMVPMVGPAGEPWAQTAPEKLVWFNSQQFPAGKPDGGKRILCLGGSTTYGHPYWDLTSYSNWLRQLLPLIDPATNWEVINAGGISYASYRVAAVLEEMIRYQPDVVVVYCAHNEFLERRTYQSMFDAPAWQTAGESVLSHSHSWQWLRSTVTGFKRPPVETLAGEVDEMLNHSIGPRDYVRDNAWRAQVRQHYRFNLERMVTLARAAGAEIVFVQPASNLRDCSPFKSTVDPQLSAAQSQQLATLINQAAEAAADQQHELAVERWTRALAIDPAHPSANYELGNALFQLQRFDQARAAYSAAIDHDVCPLRATTAIVSIVRDVALKHRVPLVPFADRLRRQSQHEWGHDCFGTEHFLDHVHPTVDVHGDLAVWILDTLREERILQIDAPDQTQITEVAAKINDQIDPRAEGISFRNLAKVMHWAGKFPEAAGLARRALLRLPEDLESYHVLADSLANSGQTAAAIATYEKLFEIGDFQRAYLPFGELLAGQGHHQAAKAYLMFAAISEAEPHHARAWFLLGDVHQKLGEWDHALEAYQQADRLYPGDPEIAQRIAQLKQSKSP